jgi:hypothetical protein
LLLVRLSSAEHLPPSKEKRTEEEGREKEEMLPSLIDPFAPPVFVACRELNSQVAQVISNFSKCATYRGAKR